MSRLVKVYVIFVVSTIWALSFIASLVKDISFSPEINAAFMGTIGALLASLKGDNDNEPDNEDEHQRRGNP